MAQYYFDLAQQNGIDKSESFLSKQSSDDLYQYGMELYEK